MLPRNRPTAEEHAALIQALQPLPIEGTSWPAWIKIASWIMLLIIGFQFIRTATSPAGQNVNPYLAASVTLCYAALVVIARYMTTSRTRISEEGIEQNWITRRVVKWEEIHFAKFIPLISSKKLMCFTDRGRPFIFQGGTKELQIAFARIALVYKR
ncbi:MAG: hypothetical protein H5U29_07885 [Pusillimonas sp.]|nr:hypothetical protein [Pusillimonas sp.]